ncbi:Receptor-like kinase LIP1 [Linum perenne]
MNTVEQISYDFVLALLSIILIILSISLFIACRTQFHSQPESETQLQNPNQTSYPSSSSSFARVYNLTEIDTATDGFNQLRIIGRGNSGTVYAAVLPSEDLVVAVKRIHPPLVLRNASLGFSTTIKSLIASSAHNHHPNIVNLLGYCQAPGERIVVMEFVGMVNLDYLLHESEEGDSLLDWNRRLKIAAGVARGIEYLHEKMGPGTVHGCVKASKIVLDAELNPKICDYGLWFLKRNNEVGGGYTDEEYWRLGASKESDVYGFGVVLLELLTGRRSTELAKWAVPLMKEMMFSEILDHRLVVKTNDVNVIVRLCKVASACVANGRMSRPTISQVAAILNCLERDSSC